MSEQSLPIQLAAKRDASDQVADAPRRELVDPWHPEDETDPSEEFPTARYIVGRLKTLKHRELIFIAGAEIMDGNL